MSDVPEADAQDQRRSVADDADDGDDRPPSRAEAPEADAQEQAEGLRRAGRPARARSAEVPDADAYEQSQEVPDDEDDIA